MKRIHLEKILDGLWPIDHLFEYLDRDLPSAEYSWDEFVHTGIMKELAQYGGSPTDLMSVAQMLFHSYAFQKGAGKIYEVSDSIGEMLLNTKLDIDTSLVKSPCLETIIVIPDNLIKVRNVNTGWHWAYNIYVNFKEFSDYDKIIKVLCVGKENENSSNELDDALFYFKVSLKDRTVSESLKKEMDGFKNNPDSYLYSNEEDWKVMPRLFYLVLNVLLYVTSADCDIKEIRSQRPEMEKRIQGLKNPAKIRKLIQKCQKESRYSHYMIGSSIVLSPEEKQLYEEIQKRRLSVRFLVGGHWRAQWYGPKDNQVQKPKWIRPFFKGPEIGEIIKSIGVIK